MCYRSFYVSKPGYCVSDYSHEPSHCVFPGSRGSSAWDTLPPTDLLKHRNGMLPRDVVLIINALSFDLHPR